MVRQLRLFLLMFFMMITLLRSPQAKAEASREFLLSCTYGVLAGALVGAASLAVEDDPASKMHRVARGASLGLYAGILLGAYVVYVVPSQMESEQERKLEEQYQEAIEPGDYGMRIRYEPPKLTVFPLVEQNQLTGAAMNYRVMDF